MLEVSKLSSLPEEIQLRILDFLDTTSLANVAGASKYWHSLIADPAQDKRVYYNRTHHPPDAQNFSFLKTKVTCFTQYYTNYASVDSWQDLCRYQSLLGRSWSRDSPTIRTSLIAPRRGKSDGIFIRGLPVNSPRVPIWRFRPDFHRRFVIVTTQHGGLLVTDMDTGTLLWSRSRGEVRGYAHLEYSNGWMAFDRNGNYIEIWRHIDGAESDRGKFEKVFDLPHDVETRGFQMLWPTLCVVSTEEKGFVYDLAAEDGPRLTKRMTIASGTVGHLDQNEVDTVAYCIGTEGYIFHSKSSGALQGRLRPKEFTARGTYHVSHRHFDVIRSSVLSKLEPIQAPFPPRRPVASHKPQTQPLREGANTARQANLAALENDEWGAGLLKGDMFVAISKGGRCMICLDWPTAIRSPEKASQVTFIIEMEIDATMFDFGGWLGVKRGPPGPTRIVCEVDDKIYVFRLDSDAEPLINGSKKMIDAMNVISFPSSCTPDINVPISFMGVYDDCIMHTCLIGVLPRKNQNAHPYIAKTIRVLSFAPTPQELGLSHHSLQTAATGEDDDIWDDMEMRLFNPR